MSGCHRIYTTEYFQGDISRFGIFCTGQDTRIYYSMRESLYEYTETRVKAICLELGHKVAQSCASEC